MLRKLFNRHLPYLVSVYLSLAVYSAILSYGFLKLAELTNANIFLTLNYDAFMQTAVALNTGVLIAIFISLFYGSEESLTIFKKQRKASRQVIQILITNTAIIATLALFVNNISDTIISTANAGYDLYINLVALALVVILTYGSMSSIYTLIKISLRKD